MTRITERERLLAQFIHEVWNEGRFDAVDALIAPAYTICHDPGDPWDGQTLDRAGFKERLRQSRAPFPDQRFHIQDLFANDDAVAVTWRWSATHKGEFPGFPTSGQTIRMSGATAYYFDEENRLAGHWQITDRLGVFRQLQGHRQQRSEDCASAA